MATWIVGGVVALLVAAIVIKMVRDKKAGKGSCSCGGDCGQCHKCHCRCYSVENAQKRPFILGGGLFCVCKSVSKLCCAR